MLVITYSLRGSGKIHTMIDDDNQRVNLDDDTYHERHVDTRDRKDEARIKCGFIDNSVKAQRRGWLMKI